MYTQNKTQTGKIVKQNKTKSEGGLFGKRGRSKKDQGGRCEVNSQMQDMFNKNVYTRPYMHVTPIN